MIVIDGENCVLGRVASHVAKAALGGETIAIVNAEKIVITGNPASVFANYRIMFDRKNAAKPDHSAKVSRRPDFFVKRTIRGMLPRTKRGAEALRKVTAYMGVPEEISAKAQKVYEAREDVKTVSVLELCKYLGWKA